MTESGLAGQGVSVTKASTKKLPPPKKPSKPKKSAPKYPKK